MWSAQAYVDVYSHQLVAALGLFLGGLLGVSSFMWVTGRPFLRAEEAHSSPPTALQIASVETEKAALADFLSGLPELERALDDWFYLHAGQTPEPVWFLSDNAAPALTPSAPSLLGCKVEDPSAEFPLCRGSVYSFYDLQCDSQACSWTFCRHNEEPHSCTYSMNGYRDGFGRWENNCNIIFPQARAFCEYLRDEKGFIVNDIS